MTWATLVDRFSRRHGLPTSHADGLIKSVFTELLTAAWRDGHAAVPGFLTLRRVATKGRRIRNPQTGELMTLPAATTVRARVVGRWRRSPP